MIEQIEHRRSEQQMMTDEGFYLKVPCEVKDGKVIIPSFTVPWNPNPRTERRWHRALRWLRRLIKWFA